MINKIKKMEKKMKNGLQDGDFKWINRIDKKQKY